MASTTGRSFSFRIIRGVLAAVVGVYIVVVGSVWYAQASFIFSPSRTIDLTPADLGVSFNRVTLPLGTDRLSGWWVPSQSAEATTLLYFHGNAGDMSDNAEHVVRLHNIGLNVFIIDYRGYGESTGGPPRERLIHEDAERAWAYLVNERKIPASRIVIYGHSLGGAVAIDLASTHPEAGALISESTLTSVIARASKTRYAFLPLRLIVTERFDSLSRIGSIKIPKLIIHGQDDPTTPATMAQELYDAASAPKQLALIPGGRHEDSAVKNPEAYFGAVKGFLAQYLR